MTGRAWVCAAMGLLLAACESTPKSTTSEATVGIGTLQAYSDQCVAQGYVQGSDAMVDCMRRAHAADTGATPAG